MSPLDDSRESRSSWSRCSSAASETLPKVVAGGAYELWKDPVQRRALVDDPSAAPRAFEEMLRYDLPLQFIGRTLLVDAEVAGESMRAGQRVVLLLICANRDEREFADPERFDSTRLMERHLGLGHGVHVCIGAHVARLEGTVMLQELPGPPPRLRGRRRRRCARGFGVPRELGRDAHRGALTG